MKLSKRGKVIVTVFVVFILLVALGINRIGPLDWLSTKCPAGRTKVVTEAHPGAYDYECR